MGAKFERAPEGIAEPPGLKFTLLKKGEPPVVHIFNEDGYLVNKYRSQERELNPSSTPPQSPITGGEVEWW